MSKRTKMDRKLKILPSNEKPLPTDQICWDLNDRSCYEEFEYGNYLIYVLILHVLGSPRKVEFSVEK